MKFYRLDEVPASRDDQVFKESPTINAIAALILFGIAITALVLGIEKWRPHGMAPSAPYWVAGIFGLIGLFPLANFRASLKPSNWLLRCNLSGLIIKYRAYENWRLPADTVQAVGFDYGEIAWAKIVKERRTTPAMDGKRGNQTEYLTYIEVGLVNPNTSDLETNLEAERSLRPDGVMVTMDYPVQVLPDGIVEVRWTVGIRPSAHKALEVIGRRVKIADPEHRKTDLTHHDNASTEEERAKIIALAKSGDEIGAVKLARQVYGYSLSQATEFVDKLLGRD
jgi:hypothetical protein